MWYSKMQAITATSSSYAEYIAMFEVTQRNMSSTFSRALANLLVILQFYSMITVQAILS
jgi:hypothetical protein